jgi:carbon monoxide dehydrogenase subunit G
MATGKAEVSIDRSADEVWKLVREFGSLGEWMPGIDSCVVNGDVRTLEMMGMEMKEQLRELDDDARSISYSLIEAPIPNLESHLATISVAESGTGSHVTWSYDVSPDELAGLFGPVYENSIGAIKKQVEG